MSRLPTPGSDDNVWGSILNDFLGQSLATDGTLKAGVIGTTQVADSAITSAKIADGTITTADISTTAGITKAQLATAVQTSLTSADNAATAGANSNITSLSGLTTALSVAQGGTGSTTKNFVDLTTAQTVAGVKTFSNSPVISSITNTGTLTLPTSTDTLVGRATTDTLTSKTLTAPVITSPTMNATTVTTDATTGLTIAGSTTQKIGFYGTTPTTQQAASQDLGTALSNLGLRASGTSYTFNTSGSATFSASTFTLGSALVTTPVTRTTAFTTMTNTSAWINYLNSTTAWTITLQTSPTNGINFVYKNINTGAVTIAAGSGQTIDGAASITLAQYEELWIQSVNSTTWGVIDRYSPNTMRTNTAQTITATQTFSTAPVISSIVNTGTLTLPTTTDTLVGRATTDTLTGKTISGASNTFSAIPESAVTNLTTDLAAKVTGSGTAKITVGTTAPSSPAVGDLWVDTN